MKEGLIQLVTFRSFDSFQATAFPAAQNSQRIAADSLQFDLTLVLMF
jgi:hypothetical protein